MERTANPARNAPSRRLLPGSLREAAGSTIEDLHALLKTSADRLRECAAMAGRATLGKADVQAMLSAATRLRDMADALREQAVVQARKAGWSWEAIGRSLGITKQAAQQRYGDLSR